MRLHLGSFAPMLYAMPLLLAGCGGAGTETPTTATAPPPQAAPARTETATGGGATADGNGAAPTGELVTPQRIVDTKKLVDVVEQEVKGGESKKADTTPVSIYWQSPDESMIHDEPLEVTPPLGLPPLVANAVVPASNPLTKGKVELGKQLYFDPRISLDGTVSCATCHNPEKGWTDNLKTSVGIKGQVGGRNAPTVLNTAYGKTMFWDGRAPSLEGQCQGPPQNPIEMGDQSFQQIIERLRQISGYREQFQKVFGTDVTVDGLAKAIASFERASALSGNSAYDRYIGGGGHDPDLKALSESQKRGMILFGLRLDQDDDFQTDVVLKKAECTSCHVGNNFTDELFHNLGVGWDADKGSFADLGRFAITAVGHKNPAEIGAFKTPTCRDVARTAPYMHDGSLQTLEEVVEHYDKGGHPNPWLDKDMKKLNLTAQEKADLVEFMKALTGEEIKVALPTLPAGPDGQIPDPSKALTPPSAPTAASMIVHPPFLR